MKTTAVRAPIGIWIESGTGVESAIAVLSSSNDTFLDDDFSAEAVDRPDDGLVTFLDVDVILDDDFNAEAVAELVDGFNFDGVDEPDDGLVTDGVDELVDGFDGDDELVDDFNGVDEPVDFEGVDEPGADF